MNIVVFEDGNTRLVHLMEQLDRCADFIIVDANELFDAEIVTVDDVLKKHYQDMFILTQYIGL